ncbi:YheC/YheD family protein [Alteribacter natronophilus]|uniref:YheC/YheD family protein n=1 Tax=Alteribacter natronophilus TaxID=2583810 RepID=UPI00110D3AD4|nr:YheC/YheD family protein [Alteribacter natronophilus]TMW71239.1 hypothetical protein FGB90_14920 [Alteribacter natronophilus]
MQHWIRISELKSEELLIVVPDPLYSHLGKVTSVQHGRKTCKCKLTHKKKVSGKGTKSSPFVIKVSSLLIRKSLFITDIPYQIIKQGDTLKFGPFTVVLTSQTSRLNVRRQIIPRTGGVLISAKPNSFNWGRGTVRGEFYHQKKKKWIRKTLPLPEVIFNNYVMGRRGRRTLLKRCKEKEILFFNTRRYDKRKVEKVMSKVDTVKDYLIRSTIVRNPQDVFTALKLYKKVVLKPAAGARGKGIVFLRKKAAGSYQVYNYRSTAAGIIKTLSDHQLRTFLNSFNFQKQRYITQKWVLFKTFNKRPFDLRVHMHKDDTIWKCAGIECRVAGKGQKLTNVSKGGKAVSFSKALYSYPSTERKRIRKKIVNITKNICKGLDDQLPSDNFADLGIDIAIGKKKRIYFIEINFNPQFNGFRKINYKVYEKINWQPLIHAAKKQGFKVI